MTRFFIQGGAVLLLGALLPVALWANTKNPQMLLLMIVLVPLAAWVFRPRHLRAVARGISFFLGGRYVDPNHKTIRV